MKQAVDLVLGPGDARVGQEDVGVRAVWAGMRRAEHAGAAEGAQHERVSPRPEIQADAPDGLDEALELLTPVGANRGEDYPDGVARPAGGGEQRGLGRRGRRLGGGGGAGAAREDDDSQGDDVTGHGTSGKGGAWMGWCKGTGRDASGAAGGEPLARLLAGRNHAAAVQLALDGVGNLHYAAFDALWIDGMICGRCCLPGESNS
jgi:hypothetical protein